MDAPLRSLGLAPSGTILVLPKQGTLARTRGDGSSIMDFVWLLLTPLTVLWGLLSSFVTPTTVQTNVTPTEGPGQGSRSERKLKTNHTGIRSDGNVARLRNLSDDDDETNTWNGNSTQQQ